MGMYFDLKSKSGQIITKTQFRLALLTNGFYSPIPEPDNPNSGATNNQPKQDPDELYFRFGVLNLTNDEEFNKGELASIRISWSSSIEALYFLVILAEKLHVDLFDDSGVINLQNSQEVFNRFSGNSDIIKKMTGTSFT